MRPALALALIAAASMGHGSAVEVDPRHARTSSFEPIPKGVATAPRGPRNKAERRLARAQRKKARRVIRRIVRNSVVDGLR